MKVLLDIVVLFGLVTGTTTPTAGPLPKEGTVIYSNACESDGGDFEGFRVTITSQRSSVLVLVDFNDSGPDGKATARGVKYDQASGQLSFRFEGDLPHDFSGTVSATALRGAFDGEAVSYQPHASRKVSEPAP
jgi:hypothetical protein